MAELYQLHHVRARKAGGGQALKGPRRNQRGDFDGNVTRLHSQIADVDGCAAVLGEVDTAVRDGTVAAYKFVA